MIKINNKLSYQEKKLEPAQILVLGFGAVIILGAVLLNLPIATLSGKSVGFINSLFTATSAVCVTGLVVVDTGTYWSMFGQLVIMILIQIGGLGIMTMATLITFIAGKRITLRSRIIMSEALNQITISGVVRLTKHVLVTTFLIESIGAIILSTKFIPIYGTRKGIFFAIFHSISAFCNAGFDLIGQGRSLTNFIGDPVVNFTIMGLIIVGGLGFAVITEVIKIRRFKKLSLHSKVVIASTGILILSGFILFFLIESFNPGTLGNLSIKDKFFGALFQSVTTRTAGFNTMDLASMNQSSKFLTIVYMFIGGSPGSTAGGIKTTTFALVILTIISVIRGRDDVEVFRRRINRNNINRALAVLSIGIFIVTLITTVLCITEVGKNFLDLFFEATSAFGTVGLSMGITSELTVIGKIIISLTMFAGRVGPMTIVFALARKQKSTKALIRYPEDRVIVG